MYKENKRLLQGLIETKCSGNADQAWDLLQRIDPAGCLKERDDFDDDIEVRNHGFECIDHSFSIVLQWRPWFECLVP